MKPPRRPAAPGRKPGPPARRRRPRLWLMVGLMAGTVVLAALAYRDPLAAAIYRRMPLADLESQVRNRPDDDVAAATLARRLMAQGSYARAAAALSPATEGGREAGDLWLLRAEAELGAGDDRSAFASVQMGLPTAAHPAAGHWLTGRLSERAGDERAAESEYEAALRIDPRHVGSRIRLGFLALDHGHNGRALDHLAVALAAEPGNAEALRLRARALLNLGQVGAAETAARAAVRSAPRDAQAEYLVGAVLKAAPGNARRDEAEAAFRRALTLDPALMLAHHEIGMLRLEQGDSRGAAGEFEAVLAAYPLHAPSFLPLVQAYRHLGRDRDAERLLGEYRKIAAMQVETAPLESALWAMPDNVAMRLRLARLYLRYRRPDLARTQVALALKSQPGQPEALALRGRLAAEKP